MKKIITYFIITICCFLFIGCKEQPKEEPQANTPIANEVTLTSSKEELSEIKDNVTDAVGKLKYISGTILSDLKPITILTKNSETGNIEEQNIEVYEFKFVTKDNKTHNVFLKVDSIGKVTDYKVGDSVYYDLTDSLTGAWYIGENQEVLYLAIIE